MKAGTGPPGLPYILMCQTCHGLRPRGSKYRLAICVCTYLDFRLVNNVVLPIFCLRGSFPSALWLTACLLAVITQRLPAFLQRLATRWMAFLPGRDLHPLEYTTLPGRTYYSAIKCNYQHSKFQQK
jgi:hypothetical protein